MILAAGLLFFFYLINYQGSLWHPQVLWFILCIGVILLGTFMANRKRINKQIFDRSNQSEAGPKTSKLSGKVIKLTSNNCEVKTRSYQMEAFGNSFPSRVEMLDSLANTHHAPKTEDVVQSYVVFQAIIRGTTYKFVSSPTSFGADYIRRELDEGRVSLVFNPHDPTQYAFETSWK
jgi:hypothetical protein